METIIILLLIFLISTISAPIILLMTIGIAILIKFIETNKEGNRTQK